MLRRTIYDSLSPLLVVVLGASAVQCSSSSRDGYEPPPDAERPPQLVSPVDAAAETNGSDGIDQECTGENKQIYILSRSPDAIYRFDPASLTFALVGRLDCPWISAVSMAIDRRGYAWVSFGGGMFVNVRLSDLQCKEVVLNNVPAGLRRHGMGFTKDDSSTGESLFLHNANLFRVDPTTRDVSLAGRASIPGVFELTGTGDGKLFGFCPDNGVITRFDKATGASLETYRTSAVGTGSWAFAQWGGDFWIFLGQQATRRSSVYRYSPATDETTIAMKETGIDIVGAGSSTCAPFEPVK